MATRMQQRRGTAAQWISTNAGAGPVLNAGEIGWESDTNKFKIGDGVNNWTSLDYFSDINSTVNPAFGSSITFEGATANDFETTLAITDPTADRTITLPDVTGTVITTGNLSDITNIGVFTSTITMEGSTANDFELTLSAGDPTADRTVTFPDATGTVALTSDVTTHANLTEAHGATGAVVGTTNTQTLTNKTLTSPKINEDVAVTATATELNYVDGVTSAIQTQLDAKSTASKTETLTNKSISLATNTVTSTLAELNAAVSDADVATLAGTETLTNKTLTTPTINGPTITATGQTPTIHGIYLPAPHNIIFEGTTADEFETTLQAGEPTADRTITLPDGTGTLALAANVAALSGATFTGAVSGTDLTLSGNLTVNGTTTNINSTNLVVEDKNIVLADVETPTDTTADGGGITLKGATDKTFNWVDTTDSWTSSEHVNLASGKSYYVNGTLLKDLSETLTNKTLTTPVISSISNTGTLTLPTDTDTLVGRATTDTLTNKTLTSPIVTGLTLNDGSIVFEGATANDFETTLQVTDPTADRTLTLPDATDTLVGRATTDTLTNKTLGSAVATTSLTLNATAELRLADTDSSHYVGFKAPETVTSNKIWVLPAADGTAGQALSTDGSGNLSWATSGGGAAFSEFMLIGA
jgi:hypothetical protein